MTLPSPSGRLRLEAFEEGGFAIETSAGKQIKTLKGRGSELVYPLEWTPDESGVIYDLSDTDSDAKDGLYDYEINDRRSKLLVHGHAESFQYSPDNRRIAFNLKKSVLDKFGILTVMDGKSYRRIRSVGTHVNGFTFSPDSKDIAFTELAKDEFGDFSSTSLRVLDIETGRTTTLLTNRRKPIYVWAGDDALLVTMKDKYSVPSLTLVSVSGGRTILTTSPNSGFMRPYAYLPGRKRAIYKITQSIYEQEAPEELWAVEPGHAPIRLFPVKGAGHE
jgi:dipeptidyl aminopeptidase/acylaminoacyl peptidase